MTDVKRSKHGGVHRDQQRGGDRAREKRRYRLGQRADQMAQTRQRIARAAFELHREIGPAATTITAVAERAGVQRHTVYRHFPDMASLYACCTEYGMRTTGLPDPEPWAEMHEPVERLGTGLRALYDYFRRNERLLTNVLKDELSPAAPSPAPDPFREYMGRVHEVLTEPFPPASRARSIVTLALDFWVWRSLVRGQGRSVEEASELLLELATGDARTKQRGGA